MLNTATSQNRPILLKCMASLKGSEQLYKWTTPLNADWNRELTPMFKDARFNKYYPLRSRMENGYAYLIRNDTQLPYFYFHGFLKKKEKLKHRVFIRTNPFQHRRKYWTLTLVEKRFDVIT
jgi:hypothetical protein